MDLSKRLMELRMKNGLTQGQVADAVGVSRQSISKWELDEAVPGMEKMKKLGELYGLSVDDLLSDDPTLPESREDRQAPAPVPAKSRRGVIALLLIIAILTMAMVIGYFSQKGGGTEEEIPVGKLQEEKIVSTPETKFGFTWED